MRRIGARDGQRRDIAVSTRVHGGSLCAAAAAAVALASGAVGACGSGANSALDGFGGPEYHDDAGSGGDDGPNNTDSPFGEGGSPGVTRVTFVQASPSLGNVRLCWAVGGAMIADAPFPSRAPMPASNYPGIAAGSVAWIDGNDADALVGRAVDLYALDADLLSDLQPGLGCSDLVCTGPAPCLHEGWWKVATLASDAIIPRVGNVVAIEGCLASDANASRARCGPAWKPGADELFARVLRVSGDTKPSELVVAPTLLSPALESLLGGGGLANLSFGAKGAPGDALGALAHDGDVASLASVTLGSGIAVFGQQGFAVDLVGADAGSDQGMWTSLAQTQAIVAPDVNPDVYYGARSAYVVALVGDPGDTSGQPGRGLHVVAFAAQGQGAGSTQ